MNRKFLGAPIWVWCVSAVLGALQPAVHYWIACHPPEGTAPTGLSMGDSATLLHAMRMFENDFYSPYASPDSPMGDRSWRHYPLPYSWLYGILGAVGGALGIEDFLFLGICNGLFGVAYLLAVYLLFREVVPRQSALAFLLFALGGGPGGLAYLVAGIFDLHDTANFDAYFRRYAYEELFEGAALSPALRMPRLYYSAALAAGIGGLTFFIRSTRTRSRKALAVACVSIAVAGLLHMVLSFLVCGVALLYAWIAYEGLPRKKVLQEWATFAATLGLTYVPVVFMLSQKPHLYDSVLVTFRASLWFSCLLSAALFHLIVVPREIVRAIPWFPGFLQYVYAGLIGYLSTFFILFWAYQAYWGNLLVARDFRAAVAVSDWALLGAIPAVVYVAWRRNSTDDAGIPIERRTHAWLAIWLLLAVTGAISAFGQGWFLRFAPLRATALIGPPLCALSAIGFARLQTRAPRFATVVVTFILFCGICSIQVGTFVFNGPLGWPPGGGPFPTTHAQLMSKADAALIDRIDAGRVLAPVGRAMHFGDVVTLRRDVSAVHGFAALDLSDRSFVETEREVIRFFSPEADPEWRKAFQRRWQFDYVYCPDTFPVDPEVVDRFEQADWLERVATEGGGALFRVVNAS